MGRTGAEGGTASPFPDGGNSNYTNVLVDGAPLNQPGGLVDFSNFTLDNIDKIEIVSTEHAHRRAGSVRRGLFPEQARGARHSAAVAGRRRYSHRVSPADSLGLCELPRERGYWILAASKTIPPARQRGHARRGNPVFPRHQLFRVGLFHRLLSEDRCCLVTC